MPPPFPLAAPRPHPPHPALLRLVSSASTLSLSSPLRSTLLFHRRALLFPSRLRESSRAMNINASMEKYSHASAIPFRGFAVSCRALANYPDFPSSLSRIIPRSLGARRIEKVSSRTLWIAVSISCAYWPMGNSRGSGSTEGSDYNSLGSEGITTSRAT